MNTDQVNRLYRTVIIGVIVGVILPIIPARELHARPSPPRRNSMATSAMLVESAVADEIVKSAAARLGSPAATALSNDGLYSLYSLGVTTHAMARAIAKIPPDNYQRNVFDCEDYVRAARVDMTKLAVKLGLLAPFLFGEASYLNDSGAVHAVAFAVTDKKELVFLDTIGHELTINKLPPDAVRLLAFDY